ncbi:hypothetical protein AAF712_008281 [Marasmius tenuissimus]|uniref:Uncharacterized protein n=1 Tax=Marasmius tenuissimus TaxID=585030 RepID=A0ABR2ZTV0_9AGAR
MSNAGSLDEAKAIQALLAQLGASQAWKDTLNDNPTSDPEATTSRAPDSGSSASVASLLSQLQTPQEDLSRPAQQLVAQPRLRNDIKDQQGPHVLGQSNVISIPDPYANTPLFTSNDNSPLENSSAGTDQRRQDTRHYTFQQSLPLLAELAARKDLVEALVSMKKSQDTLERQLLEERQSIRKKYDQRIKDASVKARLIGTGLSSHEARMLNDSYKQQLKKFDRERAISAWESLVAKQQENLLALGVPTMFLTGNRSDRETQQKVSQVLEGLMGNPTMS